MECCVNLVQKLMDKQQFGRRAKNKQIHQYCNNQVHIPEIPFQQKMFNSQILIRPK